jgi:hypothetical protein
MAGKKSGSRRKMKTSTAKSAPLLIWYAPIHYVETRICPGILWSIFFEFWSDEDKSKVSRILGATLSIVDNNDMDQSFFQFSAE